MKVYIFLSPKDDQMMFLFSKVEEKALSLGLSIPKLANRADMPSGHIYAWKKRKGEKGYRGASDKELEKISAVLDIPFVRLALWRLMDGYGQESMLSEIKLLYESIRNLDTERYECLKPQIDEAKKKKQVN